MHIHIWALLLGSGRWDEQGSERLAGGPAMTQPDRDRLLSGSVFSKRGLVNLLIFVLKIWTVDSAGHSLGSRTLKLTVAGKNQGWSIQIHFIEVRGAAHANLCSLLLFVCFPETGHLEARTPTGLLRGGNLSWALEAGAQIANVRGPEPVPSERQTLALKSVGPGWVPRTFPPPPPHLWLPGR